MAVTVAIVLAILNIPAYVVIGWGIFGDIDGFFEAVRYWFQPDWWSWFQGEWHEDWWATTKLWVFVVLCGLLVYGEHWLVMFLYGKLAGS